MSRKVWKKARGMAFEGRNLQKMVMKMTMNEILKALQPRLRPGRGRMLLVLYLRHRPVAVSEDGTVAEGLTFDLIHSTKPGDALTVANELDERGQVYSIKELPGTIDDAADLAVNPSVEDWLRGKRSKKGRKDGGTSAMPS